MHKDDLEVQDAGRRPAGYIMPENFSWYEAFLARLNIPYRKPTWLR